MDFIVSNIIKNGITRQGSCFMRGHIARLIKNNAALATRCRDPASRRNRDLFQYLRKSCGINISWMWASETSILISNHTLWLVPCDLRYHVSLDWRSRSLRDANMRKKKIFLQAVPKGVVPKRIIDAVLETHIIIFGCWSEILCYGQCPLILRITSMIQFNITVISFLLN